MIIRPYRAADDEELLMAAGLPKGTITRLQIAIGALSGTPKAPAVSAALFKFDNLFYY